MAIIETPLIGGDEKYDDGPGMAHIWDPIVEATIMRVTTWWGPNGAATWVAWNRITKEVESVSGVNPSTVAWKISYIWKDRTDDFTMIAGMPETTVDIPGGQRKFLSFDGSLCKSPDLDGFVQEIA